MESNRPDIDVKAFASDLSGLMAAEYVDTGEIRGTQAILRFPEKRIELLISGQKKITIWSRSIVGHHSVYGPMTIDPARPIERIAHNLSRNKDLFNQERVDQGIQYDADREAIVERFRQKFPDFVVEHSRQNVKFSFEKNSVSLRGSFTPTLPDSIFYKGNELGYLRIDSLSCPIDGSTLATLLSVIEHLGLRRGLDD